MLSTHAALKFAYGPVCLPVLVLIWSCIALVFIDLDHMLLPDLSVLPCVGLGLAAGYLGLMTSLESSFLASVADYLSFAVPAWVYSKIRGRIGMGGGDYKLMAFLGAWLVWQMLPVIFIISTVSAAMVGIAVTRLRGEQIPLGLGCWRYSVVRTCTCGTSTPMAYTSEQNSLSKPTQSRIKPYKRRGWLGMLNANANETATRSTDRSSREYPEDASGLLPESV